MNGNIGFIGGGSMAEGMIKGMLGSGKFEAGQIAVYNRTKERAEYLTQAYGVNGSSELEEAVRGRELLILAVSEAGVVEVCQRLKPLLTTDTVFASICAGSGIRDYQMLLGADRKIISVMPNTLTETGYGYSAFCKSQTVTEQDLDLLRQVLEAIGQVLEVREEMFDVFTAYSSAGPAFILEFLNAMIDAGVRAGFSRKEARKLCLSNLIGTARQVEQTGDHPLEVLDRMTSPGGVTIEAVYAMNRTGMYGAVMESVADTVARAKRE